MRDGHHRRLDLVELTRIICVYCQGSFELFIRLYLLADSCSLQYVASAANDAMFCNICFRLPVDETFCAFHIYLDAGGP